MVRIFQRSEENYCVRYVGYIGDGDAKTYQSIVNANPYGIKAVKELECTGHVQKRMGTRLRRLKKQMTGTKLSDGKSWTGKGRLTDACISQITSFYGNAIRAHENSVEKMKDAIWAIWYHRRSSDENPSHYLCPPGPNSWCKWQNLPATRIPDNACHANSLPEPIMDAIKPIFADSTKEHLLERCIGGKTQNVNENLNNVIWKMCPQTGFRGAKTVQAAAYIAAATSNDGADQVGRRWRYVDN
ncbi:uncharacterized protein LOC125501683 isoform X2 [Athalia rosae]|uniref:uncharacterized protein LOC125501683 isoform X2 n=1 Tax=Athalia rosae TaxID=37344 RepID=UPI00203453EF|nr:uncharacterized protein LOC125501683 isoform X2 [Athalia rosae]